MRRIALRSSLLTVLVLAGGCGEKGSSGFGGRVVDDGSPIDVTEFGSDPKVAARALGLTFAQAVARLGPMAFEARTHFVFSRGGEDYDQDDVSRVRQDDAGNYAVALDTGKNSVEFYLVDPFVYVRQDKGHSRKKPRRDATTDAWRDTAWSSIAESLSLFAPQLTYTDAQPEKLNGRETMRYKLALSREAPTGEKRESGATATPLPVAPPARWRELAKPLDVAGAVWLDQATGVVVKVKLEGKLEIPDRDVRPTQLSMRYDAQVKDIGKVAPVVPPESVPEYMRSVPPSDPISFFRSELPPPDETDPKKSKGK